MSYLLGAVVELSTTVIVDGVLTDDATMALTITKPDGTEVSPAPTITHDGTGLYSYNYEPPAVGRYVARWESDSGVDEEEFVVVSSSRAIVDYNDLKTWLGIDDNDDDVNLRLAAGAANRAVMRHCGRSFEYVAIGSETARVYRPDDCGVVYVDDFHDVTGLVVKTDDTDAGTFATTWAATDFEVEPLNGLDGGFTTSYYRLRAVANRRFPLTNQRAALQVTAAWGWTSVPEDVATAGLIKAARLYKRKDSPEGVLGGAGDFGLMRISLREDPDVCQLLRPYVRTDRAALIG